MNRVALLVLLCLLCGGRAWDLSGVDRISDLMLTNSTEGNERFSYVCAGGKLFAGSAYLFVNKEGHLAEPSETTRMVKLQTLAMTRKPTEYELSKFEKLMCGRKFEGIMESMAEHCRDATLCNSTYVVESMG